MLKDKFEQIFEEDVVSRSAQAETSSFVSTGALFFVNKKIKYIWDATARTYVKLKNLVGKVYPLNLYEIGV